MSDHGIREQIRSLFLWLKPKVQDKDNSPLWNRNEWCGDTETGFHTEYEFNWEALEREIDEWIKQTYGSR